MIEEWYEFTQTKPDPFELVYLLTTEHKVKKGWRTQKGQIAFDGLKIKKNDEFIKWKPTGGQFLSYGPRSKKFDI